jgi:hypothetical protein
MASDLARKFDAVLRPCSAKYLPVIINMRRETLCIISVRKNVVYV